MTSIQQAFESGRQAALAGHSIHYNPHRNGPAETGGDYVAWEDGWYSIADAQDVSQDADAA